MGSAVIVPLTMFMGHSALKDKHGRSLHLSKRVICNYLLLTVHAALPQHIHSINVHTKTLYFVDEVFQIKNKLELNDVLDIRFA